MSTDKYREWDGAYVLGALSPEERLEFEDHLPDCPDCTAAVAESAGPDLVMRRFDAPARPDRAPFGYSLPITSRVRRVRPTAYQQGRRDFGDN